MSELKPKRSAGRPPGAKNKKVSRQLREFRKKLDAYLDDALRVGQEIMNSSTARDGDRLKAAHKFIDLYVTIGPEISKHEKLMKELEESEEDDNDNKPVFPSSVLSLGMLNKED